MTKLIYKELSYKIVGALFNVYNQMQYGHNERVYQKAVAEEFKEQKIPFKRELYFPLFIMASVFQNIISIF